MSSSAIIDRIRELLASNPPFKDLSEEERKDVLADISVEYFEPGEVVIEQGEARHPGLYLVESGLVRLMDVENQQMVDKCKEGDFFGSFGLLKGGASIYQAKATEESVCALIGVKRFQQLYDRNEEFRLFFDRDIQRYMRHLDQERDVSGKHLLLSRKLSDLNLSTPITCEPDATAREVAGLMSEKQIDSVVVQQKGKFVGIVTEGDLRDKVLAKGKSADTPARRIMSKPVQSLAADRSIFDVLMHMIDTGVSHLLVKNNGSEATGIITDRDVNHFRRIDPLATLHRIDRAPSIERLADARDASNGVLLRLYRQGVAPESINTLMARLNDRVIQRVIELTKDDMRSRFKQATSNVRWAWLRLGSGGRREASLNSKQHNAIVYDASASSSSEDKVAAFFDDFANEVNQSLEACGFPQSDVIAGSDTWRRSLKGWKKAYRTWVHKADADSLAKLPVFFDLRALYGNADLVDELKQDIIDALNVQEMDEKRDLLSLLAKNAFENKPPLSFFGRFVLDRSGEHRNAFDIRRNGIIPIVDLMRILAIESRYLESPNTVDRLQAILENEPELKDVLQPAQDAYSYFTDFRLEHQLQAFESGEEPNNYIDPNMLSKLQRNLLKSAFTAVAELQDEIAKRYDLQRGWSFT